MFPVVFTSLQLAPAVWGLEGLLEIANNTHWQTVPYQYILLAFQNTAGSIIMSSSMISKTVSENWIGEFHNTVMSNFSRILYNN